MASDLAEVVGPEDKVLTDEFRRQLLEATEFAHTLWRLQAHFQNVTIVHQWARGGPSCPTGPALERYFCMAPSVATLHRMQEEIAQAVATVISVQFAEWQNYVTVCTGAML
jgi:hypothetical protein